MTKMVGLEFKFQYRQGNENGAAEVLSRVGHLMGTQLISQSQPQWLLEVQNSYVVDMEATIAPKTDLI